MTDDLKRGVTAPGEHETDPDEHDETESVHPDLWRAMVSEVVGAAWYLDRHTSQILRVPDSDGRPGSPVEDAPSRFLLVPTLATDRQRSHARHVLAELVGAERAAWLTAQDPWLRHFHEHATPELRQQLSDARRAWVIAEVRAWLDDHGISEDAFIRVMRSGGREARGRRPRDRAEGLRRAIHRAVDRMSPAELAALPIPARMLVSDDS